MYYINTLPIRYINGERRPTPVKGEGYYHQYEPVEFTMEVKNSDVKHTAIGRIYLTDKRLIFIADKSSKLSEFDTFYIIMTDIVSSVMPPKFTTTYRSKTVFSTEITLKKSVLKISVNYCGGYEQDVEAKGIFEDYYGIMGSEYIINSSYYNDDYHDSIVSSNPPPYKHNNNPSSQHLLHHVEEDLPPYQ
nr:12055_t:CDS:2 [Entrophospora candida]